MAAINDIAMTTMDDKELDTYHDNIADAFIAATCGVILLLITFKIIPYYLSGFIAIAINLLRTSIIEKVKKHYKQPPTPQAFKVVRMFYWLSWVLLVGIGVWGFYRLFNG